MALWSNLDNQAGKPKHLGLGQLKTIQLSGTMTGYTSGSFTIGAPPAGGVQAVATYTAVGGVITSFVITNPGAGYTSPPSVTAAGGSGGTFTAVLNSINKVSGPNSNIVFVDQTEAQVATNRLKGIDTPGWGRYVEWVDNAGNQRYKFESLIAMNVVVGISGDNADDAIVGDVAFAIQTQPSNASVTAPAATSFTVSSTGATGYQWQVRPATGGQYQNITNGGVYTNATTATLNISNSTGLNGYRYRCQVANTTAGSAGVSNYALLTVA